MNRNGEVSEHRASNYPASRNTGGARAPSGVALASASAARRSRALRSQRREAHPEPPEGRQDDAFSNRGGAADGGRMEAEVRRVKFSEFARLLSSSRASCVQRNTS